LAGVPDSKEKISSNRVEAGVCDEERTHPKNAAVIVNEIKIETARKSISSPLEKTDASQRSSYREIPVLPRLF